MQLFPAQTFHKLNLLHKMETIVRKIFVDVTITKNVNKNNADHSILFESINLVLSFGELGNANVRKDSVALLAKFISSTGNPNIKYLALESLSKLNGVGMKAAQEANIVKTNLPTFLGNLREKDISIRKRALDTLFCLCTSEVAAEVINELLDHLQEDNDYELMEEMVLKIAILSEKFAPNLSWYIDVIIRLIEYAGDYVDEDLWFRVA
jgi:AP-2 complex subunit alpha